MTNQQEFEQLVIELKRALGGLVELSYFSQVADKATDMIPLLRQEELSTLVDIASGLQSQTDKLNDAAQDLFDAVSAAEEDARQESSTFFDAKGIEVNFFERRNKQQGKPAGDQPPQTPT